MLTTNVAPAGGGSISASPSSNGGFYNSGASIGLTATPTSGCTFVNWTGTTSGIANPLSVSMSAPQTVTANFQCNSPTGTSFLTGFALSGPSLRNDFTGYVGMKVTVGANPITVSALGRICVGNNALNHTVKFVEASTGTDLAGASASVAMAGCTSAQFVYASISGVTLNAGSSYYLVSQETQGGDKWYDQGGVSSTNVATVSSAVYSFNGSWIPMNSGNNSYVPPNFQYQSGTPIRYILTTGVSPSGSGNVTATPASADGGYNSGTSVQLTATPASGCSFVNWTGTSSGSANPLPVTMSTAQTVTANFQCNSPAGTSFRDRLCAKQSIAPE